MAGTIIADYIRADANKISLNVGNTVVATINASGILSNTGNVMINSSGIISANNISTGRIPTPSVMPTGTVLQTVNAYIPASSYTASSSQSYVDSAITANITPTSSTSKILVLVSHNWYLSKNSVSATYGDTYFKLVRASTDLTANRYAINFGVTTWTDFFGHNSFSYLDSPATTSSTTYKVQFRAGDGGTYAVQLPFGGSNGGNATITLMEIAG